MRSGVVAAINQFFFNRMFLRRFAAVPIASGNLGPRQVFLPPQFFMQKTCGNRLIES
jgi:hypothetical protein